MENLNKMKEKILDITKKLYHNRLTPETATNLLLDLFAVSGQSKQVVRHKCVEGLIKSIPFKNTTCVYCRK